MKSILDCVPKPYKLWPSQTEYLLWAEKSLLDHDVLVGVAPTAAGKSLLSVTTAAWLVENANKSALMAPRRFLQDQYSKDFPWMPVLKGMNNYICTDCALDFGTCKAKKLAVGKLCADCVYIQARLAAENASMALFNFHSYFVNKMFKNVAIIDEGHGAVDLLYGLFGRKLWKCEVDYPDDLELNPSAVADVVGGVVSGLELRFAHLLKNKADSALIERMEEEIESFKMLHQALQECGNEFLIRKKTELYYGEVTKCRKTEQEYIYVKPLNIDKLAEKILWPRDKVSKIILTSATIGKQDIELLGLSDRKVAYHESLSNIPKNNRLFIIDPVASMSYKNRQESLPKIAKKIKDLALVHKGQKGVVHCTYDVARQLKSMLGESGRYMYHDNFNKDTVLSSFMASKTDKILIASGMAEGIDLKDDLARFQIIVMLQFPSLADDVMAWIAQNHPKRYKWMAIRNLVQQSGRIARHPKDYGVTYFIGAELSKKFYYETEDMWPQFFKDSMVWL